MTPFASRVTTVIVLGICLLPAGLCAQSLAGQLSISEKDGARTADLADAVLWLEPTGGGASAPRQAGHISMKGKQFAPRVQVVPISSAVDFPNDDPFRHNVFSKSGPIEFDLGLFSRGESRTMQFTRSGVYPIFCNIHARMVAYVVAIPSPYMARPGTDGRFAFAAVPAGSYRLKVWHERGGQVERQLNVPTDAASPLVIQLDARSYRFVQHRNKFGGTYTISGSERY